MAESRRSAKRLRCAIYTRKSSEEGLEQSSTHSTLSVRRVRRSFSPRSMNVLPTLYDDDGFSRGTMDRPALKLLLSDTEGRVDVVVVYKIDPADPFDFPTALPLPPTPDSTMPIRCHALSRNPRIRED